ncbi:MAG: Xanthine dehydrogenase iron-sulfur subunit (EC / Xanthine dehydrogenase, FAD binding subunit (EC [uncultured Paraburkholderia sp.]|nr:MAG: Xanthine dehydrogenase iron-sulfur subunit (EC / Xanthine dehydrogenase, FAD binding subunit (EC [uncultured Paraburkholderia sp.]CAH2940890.1 MAG: Xanthine dehydrogenase iron-sulfur subunit (EC / Xanthine dehydrogenase, FAD binding subunit (EC [uncultured Paraburkholderia sp.]
MAIYVREAGFGATPCVTRARSALSSGFAMTTQTIRFYRQGSVHEVAGVPASRTLLQHLREDLHCTGTKEGCAEGDCGACTVVVGELDAHGALALKAVNACIQFLPTLDGKALFTVEDLRAANGTLHPVQQAMVDCHGSQCGFCTPGFVMSMWALYENQPAAAGLPTRDEINTALSGNLCRYTDYRPIVDAAQKMFDYAQYPRVTLDREAVQAALRDLQCNDTFEYRAPDAGSTDIGLWVTKQCRDLGDMLYIGNVRELKTIGRDAQTLSIGAAVSLEDAYAALAADYPELAELWTRFASLPIRNAGTLGGNVANGSPIGDSMPALLALGAEVVLRHGAKTRTLPLDAFYLGYQKTALAAGKFIAALRVPRPAGNLRFRTYKVSKRYDQDISAVCAAFAMHLGEGGTIREARVAFGGMAATPKRAKATEAALNGATWNEATARQAMNALAADYQPLTDMRASSAYRLKVACNLLWRFHLETRDDAPLALFDVNVFAFEAGAPDAMAKEPS